MLIQRVAIIDRVDEIGEQVPGNPSSGLADGRDL
jgi:hypothetical protein